MISAKQIIHTSIRALISHKSRSLLTILGIVIGIASIIVITSLTKGASNLILAEVEGIGAKTFEVVPGKDPSGPSDFAQLFTDSLKDKDLKALNNKINVPFLDKITPNLMVNSKINYNGKIETPTIIGTSEFMLEILDIKIEKGRMFNQNDLKSANLVGVIGYETAKALFDNENPIGKKVKIRDKNVKIIGVFPKTGKVAFADIDNLMLLPYTSAKKYIQVQNFYNSFTGLVLSEDRLSQTVTDIEKTLRETHNITNPENDDFHVITQQDVVERVSTITNVLNILLVSVAAISLVVGGVGIMNVMLVSVTERTKEIGLRKAIGATNTDIKNQFLIEAIVLTLSGGIIGIILGLSISYLVTFFINKFQNLNLVLALPIDSILVAIIVSTSVGILFGLYPAVSASRKNPIESLRHE